MIFWISKHAARWMFTCTIRCRYSRKRTKGCRILDNFAKCLQKQPYRPHDAARRFDCRLAIWPQNHWRNDEIHVTPNVLFFLPFSHEESIPRRKILPHSRMPRSEGERHQSTFHTFVELCRIWIQAAMMWWTVAQSQYKINLQNRTPLRCMSASAQGWEEHTRYQRGQRSAAGTAESERRHALIAEFKYVNSRHLLSESDSQVVHYIFEQHVVFKLGRC